LQDYLELPEFLSDRLFSDHDKGNPITSSDLLQILLNFKEKGEEKDKFLFHLFTSGREQISHQEALQMFQILRDFSFQNIVEEEEKSSSEQTSEEKVSKEKKPFAEQKTPLLSQLVQQLFLYAESLEEEKSNCYFEDFISWKTRNCDLSFLFIYFSENFLSVNLNLKIGIF